MRDVVTTVRWRERALEAEARLAVLEADRALAERKTMTVWDEKHPLTPHHRLKREAIKHAKHCRLDEANRVMQDSDPLTPGPSPQRVYRFKVRRAKRFWSWVVIKGKVIQGTESVE